MDRRVGAARSEDPDTAQPNGLPPDAGAVPGVIGLALPIGRIGEKGRPVDRTRIRKLTLRRRQIEVRCRPYPEALRVVGELRASDLQTDLREVDVLRQTEAVGHVEEAMGM